MFLHHCRVELQQCGQEETHTIERFCLCALGTKKQIAIEGKDCLHYLLMIRYEYMHTLHEDAFKIGSFLSFWKKVDRLSGTEKGAPSDFYNKAHNTTHYQIILKFILCLTVDKMHNIHAPFYDYSCTPV